MRAGGIWAVLPVKALDGAKQRLSPACAPDFRRLLAATMIEDVLGALSGATALAGIVVVTVDPQVAALARRFGAEVHAEGATGGHTAAVTAGARLLAARGADGLLTMPGDIPGVTPGEIDRLIAAHAPAPAYTIVPAHDRRGSNAIVLSPPDLVPFAFGNDSFLPHLAAARQRGIEPKIVELEGIGLDVDNPEDLAALAAKPWRTLTHALLARTGLPWDATPAEAPRRSDHEVHP